MPRRRPDSEEERREYTYYHPLLRETFRAVEIGRTKTHVKVELVDARDQMIRVRTFTNKQARECLREVT